MYDSQYGIRIEDKAQDLRLHRVGFRIKFKHVTGGSGPGFLNEGEHVVPPRTELRKQP